MSTVTVSSKHQITLPAEVVRAYGIKPGEKLIVELVDWRILLVKESENRLQRYIGSLRGTYDEADETVDRYVWEQRASPERDEWKRRFLDLTLQDPTAEAIVDHLLKCEKHRSPEPDLHELGNGDRVAQALQRLVDHGGLRKIPAPAPVGAGPGGPDWQYYLVPEIAYYLRVAAA